MWTGAGWSRPLTSAPRRFASEFILGVGKVDKRVIFLLDIDRILAQS